MFRTKRAKWCLEYNSLANNLLITWWLKIEMFNLFSWCLLKKGFVVVISSVGHADAFRLAVRHILYLSFLKP
jgi:hypothetical protein